MIHILSTDKLVILESDLVGVMISNTQVTINKSNLCITITEQLRYTNLNTGYTLLRVLYMSPEDLFSDRLRFTEPSGWGFFREISYAKVMVLDPPKQNRPGECSCYTCCDAMIDCFLRYLPLRLFSRGCVICRFAYFNVGLPVCLRLKVLDNGLRGKADG